MDTLIFSLNAVLPILVLMSLGYILKRIGLLNKSFLETANKFVFRVALPVYLFYTIFSIESLASINWEVLLYPVIGILILFTFGLVLALIFIKDNHQKGVLIQNIFRANYAIIGIPIADALGGAAAIEVVALIAVGVVPLMNILAVISLTMFVRDENEQIHPFKSTLLKIVKNPLIIAIFAGLLVIWLRGFIPIDTVTSQPIFSMQENLGFLYKSITMISQITSPFALIVLGGTFEFIVIKNKTKEIILGTFSRIVMAPLLTLSLAVFLSKHFDIFPLTAVELPALIALFASPTAVSGAIMAKEMHNDESLAVQYVVWTTCLSIISVFLIVFIFKGTGLL